VRKEGRTFCRELLGFDKILPLEESPGIRQHMSNFLNRIFGAIAIYKPESIFGSLEEMDKAFFSNVTLSTSALQLFFQLLNAVQIPWNIAMTRKCGFRIPVQLGTPT